MHFTDHKAFSTEETTTSTPPEEAPWPQLEGLTETEARAKLKGKIKATAVNKRLKSGWHQKQSKELEPLCNGGKQREIQDLLSIDCFGKPQELPKGSKAIGLMWVLLAKQDDNGFFSRLKGRLTLLGNQERETVSRMLAYAPVQHAATLRTLLAIHVNDLNEIKLYECDIKQAYLAAKMKRLVFVKHPPGYMLLTNKRGHLDYRKLMPGEKPPKTVMQLLLALYGGMECGRLFWEVYTEFHYQLGFQKVAHEPCYLTFKRGDSFLKIPFHVDDSVIASKGEALFEWYKEKLGARFEYTMRPLRNVLGVRYTIDYANKTIKMDQTEQAIKLLQQFDLAHAKPAKAPIPNGKLPTDADIPDDEAELQRVMDSFDMASCVGGLNWLQCGTFPGLSFVLKILGPKVRRYGEKHIMLAKHAMRWLLGQLGIGLTFRGGFEPILQIFTDASHAGCEDTRRSISGIIIKLGGNTVLWKAVWQTIVSHSSTESELMALDKGATLGQFIKHLSTELGCEIITPVHIFVDNQASIDLSTNPVASGRNLHMHARFFYVRDMVYDKEYALIHLDSEEQISDILVTYKGGPNFFHLHLRVVDCALIKFDNEGKPRWMDTLIGSQN